MAKKYDCNHVAFPSISIGVYHFPLEQASQIAVKTIVEYCIDRQIIDKVCMVCFDEKTKRYYEIALKEYL